MSGAVIFDDSTGAIIRDKFSFWGDGVYQITCSAKDRSGNLPTSFFVYHLGTSKPTPTIALGTDGAFTNWAASRVSTITNKSWIDVKVTDLPADGPVSIKVLVKPKTQEDRSDDASAALISSQQRNLSLSNPPYIAEQELSEVADVFEQVMDLYPGENIIEVVDRYGSRGSANGHVWGDRTPPTFSLLSNLIGVGVDEVENSFSDVSAEIADDLDLNTDSTQISVHRSTIEPTSTAAMRQVLPNTGEHTPRQNTRSARRKSKFSRALARSKHQEQYTYRYSFLKVISDTN